MSENGAERRKRLKVLREKATVTRASKGGGSEAPRLKFRNYHPQDASIKDKLGDVHSKSSQYEKRGGNSGRVDSQEKGMGEEKQRAPVESLIQQELKKQKETQDEDELNIAPKKVNWDLKRDAEKKLEKLNRRTQRAIVEIIRERMAEEAANASADSEESGSDSDSDSSDDNSSDGDGNDDDGSNSEDP